MIRFTKNRILNLYLWALKYGDYSLVGRIWEAMLARKSLKEERDGY